MTDHLRADLLTYFDDWRLRCPGELALLPFVEWLGEELGGESRADLLEKAEHFEYVAGELESDLEDVKQERDDAEREARDLQNLADRLESEIDGLKEQLRDAERRAHLRQSLGA